MTTIDSDFEQSDNSRENTISIVEVFYTTLRRWPWILASVVFCLAMAWLYLQCTPDTYTRTADVVVKEEKKGGTAAASMEDFSAFGLLQSNSNIANEIATISSHNVMDEVVNRLALDVSYSVPGVFHNQVAYGAQLPVRVTFLNVPSAHVVSLALEVSGGDRVAISNVEVNGETVAGKFSGNLGQAIKVGNMEVLVNAVSPGLKSLPANVDLLVTKVPVQVASERFSSLMKAEKKDKEGSVIHLSIDDESAERADDILNTVISVYNESWIREKNQIAVSTSNFINERLGVIEGELGHIDDDISSYKTEHLTPDVAAASGMYMNLNQKVSQEIVDLNNQLQMARLIRKNLVEDDSKDRLLPTNTGIDNLTLNNSISRYNELVLRRNGLVAKSSEKNPLVQQADAEIASLRASVIASADNTLTDLNNQLRALQNQASQTTSKLASSPTQAKYLLSVERQQKVKESLYLFLLQKREDNELSQAFTPYNTRVINSPTGSRLPSAPVRGRIMILAGLLGLILPFGVNYLLELMNTTVRGRKDLESLSIPFLGEIPMLGGHKGRSVRQMFRERRKGIVQNEIPSTVVKPGKRDVINEAFRVVRTNLSLMNRGTSKEGAEIIGVTSFNPGSGKSFIAMNLGLMLSLKGERVLVLDGDMRRHTTSQYVNAPGQGMSAYLAGITDDIDSLIKAVPDTTDFFVLPVGATPPDPAELLESQRFADMLDTLRKQFDVIIIDCPPINVVADPQIINRYVDRTIFVVRAGLFARALLPDLETLYKERKLRNMCLMLNGTVVTTGRYGSQYGYGYGYGYGHSYNTNE